VQIARYLGAEVTGTSSASNKDFVLSLGADSHIDHHNYDWTSHPYKYDFVLDAVGGDNLSNSIEVAKEGGTMISIPSSLNEQVSEKAKAKGVNGYFFLVQSNGNDMQQIASLLEKGIIKPYVSQIFTFDQMREAHLQQETGRTVGKIAIGLSQI
jgi:NADPH:quinone reductase-like Zn-dependent oxidoreductase